MCKRARSPTRIATLRHSILVKRYKSTIWALSRCILLYRLTVCYSCILLILHFLLLMSSAPLDILACYGRERGTKYPHWMLMLIPQGGQRGTWYHSVGGPTQNRPYQVASKPTNGLTVTESNPLSYLVALRPKTSTKSKQWPSKSLHSNASDMS